MSVRYFIDTEFSERGPKYPIDLISLAIVAEDGRELYVLSTEFDADACSDWVKANVLPRLSAPGEAPIAHPLRVLKNITLDFIGRDKPEFWGYYADYDWVVFCQIFGSMVDLPKGWPTYCRDIKQLCDELGNPPLPQQGKGEHNALADARWNLSAYRFLRDLQKCRVL